jgi:hypothetical protein
MNPTYWREVDQENGSTGEAALRVLSTLMQFARAPGVRAYFGALPPLAMQSSIVR